MVPVSRKASPSLQESSTATSRSASHEPTVSATRLPLSGWYAAVRKVRATALETPSDSEIFPAKPSARASPSWGIRTVSAARPGSWPVAAV